MKEEDLIGQYCERSNGERFLIWALADPPVTGMPSMVIGVYCDGPKVGTFTRNFVTSVKLLGRKSPPKSLTCSR